MPATVTYVLATQYATTGIAGATVSYRGGLIFDILAALQAGGGNARGVGGSFAVTDDQLITALDRQGVVDRSGTPSSTTVSVPTVGPLIGKLLNPQGGQTLVYDAASGTFVNVAGNAPGGYATLDPFGHVAEAQNPLRSGFSLIDCFGHSYTKYTTIGYSYIDRVCSLLNARRRNNRGLGGSIACWPTIGSPGDGGVAWLLQERQAPGSPAVGQKPAHPETPAAPYLARGQLVFTHWGLNDLGILGSQNPQPFKEAMRTAWSRVVAAAVWETYNLSAPWATTGTWSQFAVTTYASGLGARYTNTVGDKATFTIPADYEAGKVIAIGLLLSAPSDLTIGVKINGVSQPDARLSGPGVPSSGIPMLCDQSQAGKHQIITLRFGRNPAGGASGSVVVGGVYVGEFDYPATLVAGQTIELTLKTQNTGGASLFINYAQIEADPLDGPIIVAPLLSRPYSYVLWNTWPHGAAGNARNGTLTSGSNIITAIATYGTGISGTADLVVGMPVTGSGIPAGTTITSIDSGTQIHMSNNATASGVQALIFDPMNDASVASWNASLQSIIPEFAGRIITPDIDATLNKDPQYFVGVSPLTDGAHLNERGSAILADAVFQSIRDSGLVTSRVLDRSIPDPAAFFEPVGVANWPNPFQNSWTNFGSGTEPFGWHRHLSTGVVELRGGIKSGSAANATITALPTNHRPGQDKYFPVGVSGGTALGKVQAGTGNLQINAGGSVALSFFDGVNYSPSV